MKMAVVWFAAPCSLGMMMEALMMEAVQTSEMFGKLIRRYNPDDSHLHKYFGTGSFRS
jgi:hypothetical protein